MRLGKFCDGGRERKLEREEGETSGGCLGRRCYSMGSGSYEYVVGDSELRVALKRRKREVLEVGLDEERGERIWAGSKDESFSVSKIWQWSGKKGKEIDL